VEIVSGLDSAGGYIRTVVFADKRLIFRTISFTGESRTVRERATSLGPPEPGIVDYDWSKSGDALLICSGTLSYWSGKGGMVRICDYGANTDVVFPATGGRTRVFWLSEQEILSVVRSWGDDELLWVQKANRSTREPERLYETRDTDILPTCTLSADRRYLLFLAEVLEDGFHQPELRVLDLETNTVTVLLRGSKRDYIEDVCWSPDGSHVAYVYGTWLGRTLKDGTLVISTSLNVMSVADKKPVTVLPFPEDDAATWAMKYLGSERLVYVRDSERWYSPDRTLISVVNLKTRKIERTLKGNIYTEIWPAADGKTLVLDDQGP